MALVAHEISVSGLMGPLLPPTSMIAEQGEITVVEGEIGPAATAFALALAGRVRLDGGYAMWEHDTHGRTRRDRVALIDLPNVTEPEPRLAVRTVIGQELALAEQPSSHQDVDRFLAERDAHDWNRRRWGEAPGGTRTGWLADIAARHPGVSALVVCHPDRRGGDVEEWAGPVRDLRAEDRVIVVIATPSTARLLGLEDTFRIGAAS